VNERIQLTPRERRLLRRRRTMRTEDSIMREYDKTKVAYDNAVGVDARIRMKRAMAALCEEMKARAELDDLYRRYYGETESI